MIIGSGLGGLLSAVILAKEGMNVCVLEKNKQIGGCLQTFSLQKQVFDSCVHYIGGLGEGHTLHQLFQYAGILNSLELKPFDPNGFDRIQLGADEVSFPLAIGAENFIEQLLPHFPNEKNALQHYIALLKKTGDHFPLYRLRNGDAQEKAQVAHWELSQTLSQLTQNRLLQNVLMGNNLLYAGVRGKTPFYLHALVTESYIHSAHKLLPGSSQIAKFLAVELRKHGGTLFRNTDITKLKENNGSIQYAETAEGQRFYGKRFIANIHPQALLRLLDTSVIKPAYKNRINRLEQTRSSFMLNLVLKPKTVPARAYNLYWHRSQDALEGIHRKNKNSFDTLAVYSTESKIHQGFSESLSLLTYMDYNEVLEWQDTHNHTGAKSDRGECYTSFKELKSEQLLAIAYTLIPELKGNIIAQSAATPLTFRDYTATPTGALYGIMKDVQKPAETTIAVRTKMPNLLLTGQNVNLHGVLGVSITAVATGAEWLGMDYLLQKIKGEK